jgi:hypothetical protein
MQNDTAGIANGRHLDDRYLDDRHLETIRENPRPA